MYLAAAVLVACGGDGVGPAPAAILVFTVQPRTSTAGTPITPPLEVTVQDASGKTVSDGAHVVTVALKSNPTGGVLAGTTTIVAADGVAIFSDLSLEKAGDGYMLAAFSGTLQGATSDPFAVIPAAPAKLAFAVQPVTNVVAEPMTPAVEVVIQDAFANMVTSATNLVTLSIATNPGSGTLAGTTSVPAQGGVASFGDLVIDQVETGYTLAATSAALTGATSEAFDIIEPITFATVSAGAHHTCGVTTAGVAYCWGQNTSARYGPIRGGQLGDGTFISRTIRTAVVGGLTFAEVSAGYDHTCGVTTEHAAYCWGTGGLGAPFASAVIPVAVEGGIAFAAAHAGEYHTCGVTTGAAAYCWGEGLYGQLGDGTAQGSVAPVAVAGGLTFVAMSTGDAHTCGVTPAGAAYCWGDNSFGQLGDGTGGEGFFGHGSVRTSPVPVLGGLSFVTVSAGANHTCGVTPAGAAYCWGLNVAFGVDDGPETQSLVPVLVGEGLTFAAVSSGGWHTCGVTPEEAAYCLGSNSDGQLGDGTASYRTTPVPVLDGLRFAMVSAGDRHTCGVTPTGMAYCWGRNSSGQLGDGTRTSHTKPVRVK